MATIDPIQPVQEDNPIETINKNFKILTQRIKELNINISYLDLLRVTGVYSETSVNSDNATRVRNFVATCWNLLQNYNGVYVTGTNIASCDYIFQWQGADVTNGSFIVKLPGNESVVVPAEAPKVYAPTDYDIESGEIKYTYIDSPLPTTQTITTPVIPESTMYGYISISLVNPNKSISVPTGLTLYKTYWINSNHEEVVLDGTKNETNERLTAISLCK